MPLDRCHRAILRLLRRRVHLHLRRVEGILKMGWEGSCLGGLEDVAECRVRGCCTWAWEVPVSIARPSMSTTEPSYTFYQGMTYPTKA